MIGHKIAPIVSIVSIVSLPSSKMVSEVICSYITHKVVQRDFNQTGYEFRAQSIILRVNQPLFDPGDPPVGIAKTRKLLRMVWEVLSKILVKIVPT